MDIESLTRLLTPCLPSLLKLDDKTSEKAVEQFDEGRWVKAQAIWAKLCPKVEAREEVRHIIVDTATNPEYATSQVVLREQLAKILESDPNLAAEISNILKEEHRQPYRVGDSCKLPDGTDGVINQDGECVSVK